MLAKRRVEFSLSFRVVTDALTLVSTTSSASQIICKIKTMSV